MTPTPTSGAADLPEALRLADIADDESWALVIGVRKDIAAELRRLHALAAGQATAAQHGVAYAALPTSNYAGRVYEEGFLIGTCPLYTADQMRAFADATNTLRASHGQAPASVLHFVHSAFAEIAMAFPKAFAMHKVGIADTAVLKALAAPATAQAAEPVALLVRKNSWRDGQWEVAPPNSPSYGLAWADQRVHVYTTPQPTHAQAGAMPLDEARRLFDAGWKAAALFCDSEDVVADGVIGFGACPQFEAAFSAANGIKGGQHGTE